MALTINSRSVRGKGYLPLFIFKLIPLLLVFAIVLGFVLGLGGSFNIIIYYRYYLRLLPFTVVIPVIIALYMVFAYRRVRVTISPPERVNTDSLHSFFSRRGYIVDVNNKKTSGNTVVFKRATTFARFKCLNFDKPFIEITPDEVKVVMLKEVSELLLAQFQYSKKYELNSKSNNE